MASETPAQRLKRFSKLVPDEGTIRALIYDLEKKDDELADYAIALICATFVEKAIEVAILAHLAPNDEEANKRIFSYDYRGPISDFSAKIKVGYAMGIYGPKTRSDLDLIRDIRNAFAHSLQPISFKTGEVGEMCERFQTKSRVRITVVGVEKTARQRYIEITILLAGLLKVALQQQPVVAIARQIGRFQRGLD
jgi:hypothetical protein